MWVTVRTVIQQINFGPLVPDNHMIGYLCISPERSDVMSKQMLYDQVILDENSAASNDWIVSSEQAPSPRIGYFLAASILILPLLFGAVHERVYLPFTLILSLVTAWVVLKERKRVSALLNGTLGRSSQVVALSLLATILYALAQYLFLGWSQVDHPILGSATLRPDATQFAHSWRDLVCFFAVFLLTRIYLSAHQHTRQKFLTRALMLSGFIVSLVALSHWFYDTGRLFWIFEPESVIVSDRARWPFVNPNHLADFLLPILFLILAGVVNLFLNIFAHEMARGRRRNRTIIALISSEDFHLKVLKPLLLCVPLLAVTLAILGSQSRGAWFSAVVTLLLFSLLTNARAKIEEPQPSSNNVVSLEQKTKRAKHHGRSEAAMRMDGSWALLFVKNFRRFLKPALFVISASILVFFLNSQGRDLIAGRIEYGLLYSMDDIRWTFYQDSWRMFLDQPFFGVGLSSWFAFFPRYASPELAGLNAVYLHSDPYQFLIEMGVIGVIPFVVIFLTVFSLAYKSISKTDKYQTRVLISALFCGLLSLGIASLPEFPLRIPAHQMLLAIMLGFFLSCAEKPLPTNVLQQ
jgi:O-antigen ligase